MPRALGVAWWSLVYALAAVGAVTMLGYVRLWWCRRKWRKG